MPAVSTGRKRSRVWLAALVVVTGVMPRLCLKGCSTISLFMHFQRVVLSLERKASCSPATGRTNRSSSGVGDEYVHRRQYRQWTRYRGGPLVRA